MKLIQRFLQDIKQGENIDLYLTVLVAFAVAVLNLFGITSQNIVSSISLAVLALLISSILGVRHHLETLEKDTKQTQKEYAQKIISSLSGVEVKTFSGGIECLNYLIKRISQAEKGIDDLSWIPELGSTHPLSPKLNEEYRKTVNQALERIPFREVMIFNRPSRYEKLKRRIDENLVGYSCAYFEVNPETPLLQFMIIDAREVVFFTDAYSYYFSITHPEIVGLFVEYYKSIWEKAIKLKIGNTIYRDKVNAILSSYSEITN
jgi:hypothetical protein